MYDGCCLYTDRAEQVMFSMRVMMLMQADRDLYNSQMSEREARFLRIAWQQFANSAAEMERNKLLSTKQLLECKSCIDTMKTHVATRLTWLSWSEQAEFNGE